MTGRSLQPWSYVVTLACRVRRPSMGKLDVNLTAHHAGISLAFEELAGVGGLLSEGGTRIVVNPNLPAAWRRTVFAHELAHVLLKKARYISRGDTELAADWLGDEICVPQPQLAALGDSSAAFVSGHFGVPPSRAAAQLARGGFAPGIARLTTGEVVCARCGDREKRGCPCLYFRQNRSKVERLPLVA